MRWPSFTAPQRMRRVAVVTPEDDLRDVLVMVADAGCVELDAPTSGATGPPAVTSSNLVVPRLSAGPPDLDRWARDDRTDLLAGEALLRRQASAAQRYGGVAALLGWVPESDREVLAARLGAAAGSVVPLRLPVGVDPPTQLRPRGLARSFGPLVATYATVPYEDIDPSALAGLVYVVLFGMMFADAGQGLLVLLAGLALRVGRPRRLASVQRIWPFLVGGGAASMVFGLLYGEFFGPTPVLPVLWLAPLDHPTQLLLVGVGIGGVLLAGSYAIGVINRWRESGWANALFSASGLAGAGLFLGLGVAAGGWYLHLLAMALVGGVLSLVALGLALIGFDAGAGGGGAGAAQAGVEAFDLVMRLGANLVSFARLAAFGLTHAALGKVVWDGTTGLWRHGVVGGIAALILFAVGNALTLALESLVAAIQALRLEYYELFSRLFAAVGRPFDPWHIATVDEGVAS